MGSCPGALRVASYCINKTQEGSNSIDSAAQVSTRVQLTPVNVCSTAPVLLSTSCSREAKQCQDVLTYDGAACRLTSMTC